MKKALLSLLTIATILSCSDSPKDVAKNFSESLAKGKIEEAKKYSTESTGKMIDFASSFGTLPVNPNFKFQAQKDSIVDNTAWVYYTNEKGKKEHLKLVKIDGKWLVHIESKK